LEGKIAGFVAALLAGAADEGAVMALGAPFTGITTRGWC
jgi:hypothetical protein